MTDVNPNNRITVVEYKKYVAQINTLVKAVKALLESDDRDLIGAGQELSPTLRRMSDSLARLLALTAQAYESMKNEAVKDYYVNAIYTALGRYNYALAPYGSDADSLTRLTYELEKLEKAAMPADEAAAALVSEVAAASDDLPVGEAMDQFEREAMTAYEQEQAPA